METLKSVNSALKQGHSVRCQLINYRKTGSPFWNILSINPVYSRREPKKVVLYIGFLRDYSYHMTKLVHLNPEQYILQNVRECATLDPSPLLRHYADYDRIQDRGRKRMAAQDAAAIMDNQSSAKGKPTSVPSRDSSEDDTSSVGSMDLSETTDDGDEESDKTAMISDGDYKATAGRVSRIPPAKGQPFDVPSSNVSSTAAAAGGDGSPPSSIDLSNQRSVSVDSGYANSYQGAYMALRAEGALRGTALASSSTSVACPPSPSSSSSSTGLRTTSDSSMSTSTPSVSTTTTSTTGMCITSTSTPTSASVYPKKRCERGKKRKRDGAGAPAAPVFSFPLPPKPTRTRHMSVKNPIGMAPTPGERMTVQPGKFAPLAQIFSEPSSLTPEYLSLRLQDLFLSMGLSTVSADHISGHALSGIEVPVHTRYSLLAVSSPQEAPSDEWGYSCKAILLVMLATIVPVEKGQHVVGLRRLQGSTSAFFDIVQALNEGCVDIWSYNSSEEVNEDAGTTATGVAATAAAKAAAAVAAAASGAQGAALDCDMSGAPM